MGIGNVSKLSVQLLELEAGVVRAEKSGLADARLGVVNALEHYRTSRYRLGQMLSVYKAFFCAARGWIAAAKTIGSAIGCDERTVRRIVEDFEGISDVPSIVIKALEEAGIDPAARKNARIIAKMLRMPHEAIESAAGDLVQNAIQSEPAVRSGLRSINGSLTPAERRRLVVRKKIHIALSGIPSEEKLTELVGVLEELYSELGHAEPITVTITPHRGPLSTTAISDETVAA